MNNKTWIAIAVVALAIGIVGTWVLVGGNEPVGGTRFPSGISADGTSPSAGQVRGTTFLSTGAATLQSTLALTGAATLSSTLDVDGKTSVDEFEQGGGHLATSTSNTAETLTQSDMETYSFISFTPNTGATTYTLPATSSMTTLIDTAGEMREWIFENATSGSGITATFAAGTGIDLIAVTANDDVIDETEYSRLTCIRQTDTDVTCIISELLAAD